ncbi:hypothetical protein HG535_0B06310 [Zygotorulaspora mrakii]|uniref:DNA repair protein RAD59 n=1 Tax=Zygotorulaspora mrakii TaxID=42260 RepID=A0A7H9AZE6_ZYGMR|nr:uncharacterized protein HG535_0B06310 [Zygotorulaspora mrakii]QLG71586.1 hypothetical protein HG535_0B06310 [Zygotorulaspora mrakii]
MSGSLGHRIDYSHTVFGSDCEADLKECGTLEDWNERPASVWAVGRIGLLQSKIEKYKYLIYHNKRYGKHDLSKVIPGSVLRQYANESFGFDGWKIDILRVEVRESGRRRSDDSDVDSKFTILAEAEVMVSLKDGTNTKSSGVGCATMASRGESYGKAKKEAVNDALKKAFLSFERIILEHEVKIDNKYYVDGQYASKQGQK